MAPRLCQGALILSCDAVITGLTSPIARSCNGSGVRRVLPWRSRGSTGLSKGRDSPQWGVSQNSLDCLVCSASPLILQAGSCGVPPWFGRQASTQTCSSPLFVVSAHFCQHLLLPLVKISGWLPWALLSRALLLSQM